MLPASSLVRRKSTVENYARLFYHQQIHTQAVVTFCLLCLLLHVPNHVIHYSSAIIMSLLVVLCLFFLVLLLFSFFFPLF